jgi:hypothetical protein
MMTSPANIKNMKLFLLVVIIWVLVVWAIIASSYKLDDPTTQKTYHKATPYVAVVAGSVASFVAVSMYDFTSYSSPVHPEYSPAPSL